MHKPLGNILHTSNLLNSILFVITLGNTGVTLFILDSGYFGIRFQYTLNFQDAGCRMVFIPSFLI